MTIRINFSLSVLVNAATLTDFQFVVFEIGFQLIIFNLTIAS